MLIKYIGTSNTRGLGPADFTKLGVEGDFTEDLWWTRDEPTETPDAIATVLIEELGDEFEKVVEENKVEPAPADSKFGL